MQDNQDNGTQKNSVEFWLAVILVSLGLVLEGTGMYALTLKNQVDQLTGIVGFLGGCVVILGGTVVLAHMIVKEMIENVDVRQLRVLPSIIFAAPFKPRDRRTLN